MTPRRRPHVLLVEDDPADVRLTREALNGTSIASVLHVVGDGEEALEFLRRQGRHAAAASPDLVLLDLNLPRKSGLEVLTELKADELLRAIPVVLLTTSAARGDIAAGYRLHGNAFVAKPVELDEFFNTIESIARFWLTTAQFASE